MIRFKHLPQFITITNLNWLPILANDYHKQIVLEAIEHRVIKEQVTVYGFVLMPNHMHFIWQLHDEVVRSDFQRDFLKFTSRSILNFMRMHDDPLLNQLKVKAADRSFQVWERNSLSIDLFSEKVFLQKLDYVHNNPVQPKWLLVELPEQYRWSSASFYETGASEFHFLTHHRT
ncbi:transposase [Lacibacter sp. MH-610]|uniref:transposase n=1 Tax=Lacibacter sp. MH-610 TaxID=3020883 RepID=UPI003892C9E2